MAIIDDIPKKEFFTTPPGYFEKLPAAIQSRIQKKAPEPRSFPVVKYSLQYALALILIIAVVFFYQRSATDAETILASVDTEELIAYLQDTGLTTDEVLESFEFTTEDLQAIEDEIYEDSFPGLDSAIIEL